MASEWRNNVWELGWTGGPFRLIARDSNPTFPDEIYYAAIIGVLNGYTVLRRPNGTSGVPTIDVTTSAPGSFPHGRPVLPD